MNFQANNSLRAKRSFKKSVMFFMLLAATWTPKAIAEGAQEPDWKNVIKCYSGLSTKSNVARKMTKFEDLGTEAINRAPAPEGFIMPTSDTEFFYFDKDGIFKCNLPKASACMILNFESTKENKKMVQLGLLGTASEISVGGSCATGGLNNPTGAPKDALINMASKKKIPTKVGCKINLDSQTKTKVISEIITALSDVHATYKKEMSAYKAEIAAKKNLLPGNLPGGQSPKAPDQWDYIAALDQCTDVIGSDQIELINAEKKKFPDFQQHLVPGKTRKGI